MRWMTSFHLLYTRWTDGNEVSKKTKLRYQLPDPVGLLDTDVWYQRRDQVPLSWACDSKVLKISNQTNKTIDRLSSIQHLLYLVDVGVIVFEKNIKKKITVKAFLYFYCGI